MKNTLVKFALLAFIVSGCASVDRINPDGSNVAKDECIVMSMVNSPRGWITISPMGTDPSSMSGYQQMSQSVEINDGTKSGLLFVKIKEGDDHRISRFRLREFQSLFLDLSKNNLSFSCKVNEITYVGDLTFEAIKLNDATLKNIKVSMIDNEAITKKIAEEKYPKLFEKFPYRKNLIHQN